MRKADKLFQLTNLIRAKQPITAEQIAEELDVSVRTVYRYIDDLSVSGIPVFGTTGVGYQLHENFELPPLNLTEEELDVLVLGVKMVSSWTADALSESAQSLTNKIEAVLPKKLREEYTRTIYAPDFGHVREDRQRWELMYKAIKNTYPVSITYLSLDDVETQRTIYPLALFYWGGKWTFGGWCTLREEFRNFRLDRIANVNVGQEKYVKDEKINLDTYFASFDECGKDN